MRRASLSPSFSWEKLRLNFFHKHYSFVVLSLAPDSLPTPKTNENNVNMVAIPDRQKWNVTLVWGTAGCDDTDMCDCQFPSFLIDYTTVQVNCDGIETITQQVQIINIINVFIKASLIPRSPSKVVTGRQTVDRWGWGESG